MSKNSRRNRSLPLTQAPDPGPPYACPGCGKADNLLALVICDVVEKGARFRPTAILADAEAFRCTRCDIASTLADVAMSGEINK